MDIRFLVVFLGTCIANTVLSHSLSTTHIPKEVKHFVKDASRSFTSTAFRSPRPYKRSPSRPEVITDSETPSRNKNSQNENYSYFIKKAHSAIETLTKGAKEHESLRIHSKPPIEKKQRNEAERHKPNWNINSQIKELKNDQTNDSGKSTFVDHIPISSKSRPLAVRQFAFLPNHAQATKKTSTESIPCEESRTEKSGKPSVTHWKFIDAPPSIVPLDVEGRNAYPSNYISHLQYPLPVTLPPSPHHRHHHHHHHIQTLRHHGITRNPKIMPFSVSPRDITYTSTFEPYLSTLTQGANFGLRKLPFHPHSPLPSPSPPQSKDPAEHSKPRSINFRDYVTGPGAVLVPDDSREHSGSYERPHQPHNSHDYSAPPSASGYGSYESSAEAPPYRDHSSEEVGKKPSFADTLPSDYRDELEKNAEQFIKSKKQQNSTDNHHPKSPYSSHSSAHRPPVSHSHVLSHSYTSNSPSSHHASSPHYSKSPPSSYPHHSSKPPHPYSSHPHPPNAPHSYSSYPHPPNAPHSYPSRPHPSSAPHSYSSHPHPPNAPHSYPPETYPPYYSNDGPSSYTEDSPPDHPPHSDEMPDVKELEKQAEIESSKKPKKNRTKELILVQNPKNGQWEVSKDSQIPKENVVLPPDNQYAPRQKPTMVYQHPYYISMSLRRRVPYITYRSRRASDSIPDRVLQHSYPQSDSSNKSKMINSRSVSKKSRRHERSFPDTAKRRSYSPQIPVTTKRFEFSPALLNDRNLHEEVFRPLIVNPHQRHQSNLNNIELRNSNVAHQSHDRFEHHNENTNPELRDRFHENSQTTVKPTFWIDSSENINPVNQHHGFGIREKNIQTEITPKPYQQPQTNVPTFWTESLENLNPVKQQQIFEIGERNIHPEPARQAYQQQQHAIIAPNSWIESAEDSKSTKQESFEIPERNPKLKILTEIYEQPKTKKTSNHGTESREGFNPVKQHNQFYISKENVQPEVVSKTFQQPHIKIQPNAWIDSIESFSPVKYQKELIQEKHRNPEAVYKTHPQHHINASPNFWIDSTESLSPMKNQEDLNQEKLQNPETVPKTHPQLHIDAPPNFWIDSTESLSPLKHQKELNPKNDRNLDNPPKTYREPYTNTPPNFWIESTIGINPVEQSDILKLHEKKVKPGLATKIHQQPKTNMVAQNNLRKPEEDLKFTKIEKFQNPKNDIKPETVTESQQQSRSTATPDSFTDSNENLSQDQSFTESHSSGNQESNENQDSNDAFDNEDDDDDAWDEDDEKKFEGNFQYVHNPDNDNYEYGYRMGTPDHKVERTHETSGILSKIKMNWEDGKGNFGEHFWEYNHFDEVEPGFFDELDEDDDDNDEKSDIKKKKLK